MRAKDSSESAKDSVVFELSEVEFNWVSSSSLLVDLRTRRQSTSRVLEFAKRVELARVDSKARFGIAEMRSGQIIESENSDCYAS